MLLKKYFIKMFIFKKNLSLYKLTQYIELIGKKL